MAQSSTFRKVKIMASGPITPWEIGGETVSDFIFGGSRITAGGDGSHEINEYTRPLDLSPEKSVCRSRSNI